MREAIPSTTALRIFESVARHLSCTGSAEELFLTQSAVSKQLKSLEDMLGVALFVRINRGLVLTEAGRIYLNEIKPILKQLAAASAQLRTLKSAPKTLTLSILATLGDRWLLPRFSSFAAQHPEIDVQFTNLISKDGEQQVQADAQFRFGEGIWPGCAADYLLGKEVILVANSNLLERHGGIQKPEDVAKFPLLQHFQVPMGWTEFFEYTQAPLPSSVHTIRYEFFSLLIRAAVIGLGLAIIPRFLIEDELARGDLVRPLELQFRSRYGYYLVFPQDRQSDPTLAIFREWLLQQAAQSEPKDASTSIPLPATVPIAK